MGCVQTKAVDEDDRIQRQQRIGKTSKRLVSSSRSDHILVADADASIRSEGSRTRLISNKSQDKIASPPSLPVETEKKLEPVVVERTRKLYQSRSIAGSATSQLDVSSKVSGAGAVAEPSSAIPSFPNGIKAEHAAAGWPSWLTAVAGEAVRGWLPRRAESFEKMNKIGQGTYSNVYKARDLETGKLVALKKVRFANMDPESVRFMAREIHILRRLDHPNVIKLEALITSQMSSSLYLVFEYMEHDLAGIASTPGIKFTEPQVKCYIQQLLAGLDHCHSRGVLHRDIKCSNLLIDNNGILKIADFGLATIYNPDHKQFLTSRVVTLWYRPPELLLGATDYGVSVDLWSTGCILAELLAGRPIMPGRTEVEQLHKIFKLCGSPSEEFWRTSKLPHATTFKPNRPYPRCFRDLFRDFPSLALNLLDRLLAIEPDNRGTAASALMSEFFTTKPFPCDPSSLPKYPPSKEYDAKVRNEEARRQREAVVRGHGPESGRRKEISASNSTMDIQKQQIQANSKLRATYKSKESSGFPVEALRGTTENGFSHFGSSILNGHPSDVPNGQEMKPKPQLVHDRGANLSFKSGPIVQRSNTTRFDRRQSAKQLDFPRQQSSTRYDHLSVEDVSEKQDWNHHLLHEPPLSHKKDDKPVDKESTTGYGPKKNRLHYSGPLMPPGGNVEEMLKEHERQIQHAVRRALLDKAKNKQYGEKGHSEALLYASRYGR